MIKGLNLTDVTFTSGIAVVGYATFDLLGLGWGLIIAGVILAIGGAAGDNDG